MDDVVAEFIATAERLLEANVEGLSAVRGYGGVHAMVGWVVRGRVEETLVQPHRFLTDVVLHAMGIELVTSELLEKFEFAASLMAASD